MRFEKIKNHLFSGGCPKRNTCSLYQPKSNTCISGPYNYCGKYRSIVETKQQEPHILVNQLESYQKDK